MTHYGTCTFCRLRRQTKHFDPEPKCVPITQEKKEKKKKKEINNQKESKKETENPKEKRPPSDKRGTQRGGK